MEDRQTNGWKRTGRQIKRMTVYRHRDMQTENYIFKGLGKKKEKESFEQFLSTKLAEIII